MHITRKKLKALYLAPLFLMTSTVSSTKYRSLTYAKISSQISCKRERWVRLVKYKTGIISGFRKYWFRYMAVGARKGIKTLRSQMVEWGLHNTSVFWVELNRGVLWSPSHTLSWGQAAEKKHLCAWNYVLLTCFQGAYLEGSRKSWMHISPPFQVARYE